MPKVLVTDASERAALAVIRSLGSKDVEVTAGEDISFNAGFLSKYCKHKVVYPSPQKNSERFLKYMLKLVKKERYDLIIPITDLTTIPFSKHKQQFEPYVKVAVPQYDTMIKVCDKAQTIDIAAKHDIPHPKTFFVENVEDVKEVAKGIKYPAVIKPRTQVIWANNAAIIMKVTQRNYAYTINDLVTKYKELVSQKEELIRSGRLPMIQEYVSGTGYGVEALFHNSKPKAIFVHKRLREYPITGGASTLRVSVKNEELSNLAIRMLKAIDWQGVAMVEFKVNKRGKPKLMEINGRFWGSLPLATASGVDFPYLLYRMMLDEDLAPQFNYRTGVERRWLIPGDLLWLLSSFISGSNKLHVLGEFLKSFKTADDIISITDPLPSFGAIGITMKYFLDVIIGRSNIHGETL